MSIVINLFGFELLFIIRGEEDEDTVVTNNGADTEAPEPPGFGFS